MCYLRLKMVQHIDHLRTCAIRGYQLDYREIARQNRITEQILQNYLEKRLFPHRHRSSQAPTVWDILPVERRRPNNNIQDQLRAVHPENETLESGESEYVQAVYDNDEDDSYESEGMFKLK
ncbi:hypothetical protein HHI36_020041 [Cryptolaemus montrouzieri]|uniref:Uncharacterized protein n=1 Tax=Cryptolaemus montrouzieri TaxID=559131 RepID=A0ABD2N9J3_9CUCU